MLQVGGITFHWYGLIVGIAVLAGWKMISIRSQREQIPGEVFETLSLRVIVGGILGARLWHVFTDWHLYAEHPWEAVYIWRGGLSILGAVAAGMLVLWWQLWQRRLKQVEPQISLPKLLDLAVFGLPLGQAIGRLGNMVNQELYGTPTHLPWGFFISPEYRLPGFESVTHYHPLFFYELIATSSFFLWIWWHDWRQHQSKTPSSWWQLGQGHYFLVYLLYYCVVRWCLDLIRLPHPPELWFGMGVNQIVLLGTASVVALLMLKDVWPTKKKVSP